MDSEISFSDKMWFLRNNCNLDWEIRKELCIKFKNSLKEENKWMVWVADGDRSWFHYSFLPASEKTEILKVAKKFFKIK